MSELTALLEAAIAARAPLLDPGHETALRLFNGFLEGAPTLVLDVFAKTLVIHDYAEAASGDEPTVRTAMALAQERLPWLDTVLWKVRNTPSPDVRNGAVLAGSEKSLARRVKEHGVTYALELTLNRDTSFYPDTRNLRAWAKATLKGARVLNTFAYTGSLGVAAKAGGAVEVIHTDLNRRFLTVAKDSYAMNGWPITKTDFKTGDFFEVVGQLKRDDRLFDCVFVDPPYLSVTAKGRVNLEEDVVRVLNKVRPLIADGGWLVAVNNALFVSGADYQTALETVCADGYLTVDTRVPVPEDCTGYPSTRVGGPPVDPAPFNHPTKIALLRVKRKDGRTAE